MNVGVNVNSYSYSYDNHSYTSKADMQSPFDSAVNKIAEVDTEEKNTGFIGKFVDPEEFYNMWRSSFSFRREEAGTAYEPSKEKIDFGATNIEFQPAAGRFLAMTGISGDKKEIMYGLSASLLHSSEVGKPMVQVLSNLGGKSEVYTVDVANIDIRNASQMEMFALLSYADEIGISGGRNSFEQVQSYAMIAQEKGYIDGINGEESFSYTRYDWSATLGKVRGDYWEVGDTANYKACGSALMTFSYFSRDTSVKIMDGMVIENRSYAQSLTYQEALSKSNNAIPSNDPWGNTHRDVSFFGINAPDDVKRAWSEAADEIGVDGFGIGKDGIMGHISELLVMQIEREYQGKGSPEDLLGSTVDSALEIAKEALKRLDFPLEPHTNRPVEAQEGIKREREFYLAFISRLEGISARNSMEEAPLANTAVNSSVQGVDSLGKEDLWSRLSQYRNEITEKILNGETEESIQIGGLSLTIKEWNQLMEKVDKIEEQIAEITKAEIEKRKQLQEIKDSEKITEEDALSMVITDSLRCRYVQTNPENKEPLYLTSFDETGLRCMKEGSENFEWQITFDNKEDYEKIASFFNELPALSSYQFAPNRNFWEDYLSGNIEQNDFNRFLESTDDGIPNYLIETETGTHVDREKAKYANYMNKPGFFTPISEEDVMRHMMSGNVKGDPNYRNTEERDSIAGISGSKTPVADRSFGDMSKVPYGGLIKNGVITYNGVTLVPDYDANAICLGDCGQQAVNDGKVISVPLENGGFFKFNVDNMGDIAGIIGMFSAEDAGGIMNAIEQYKFTQSKLNEMEEEAFKAVSGRGTIE